VSVDGRFTCPNVDGTRATGGCVFCDNRSFSPSRRPSRLNTSSKKLERHQAARPARPQVDGVGSRPSTGSKIAPTASRGRETTRNDAVLPPGRSIVEQLEEGIRRVKHRYKCDKFVAYFQPGTNTYAPVELLERLYRQALGHPAVVGLAIGTRPDCVPIEVVELLSRIGRDTYVSLEVGMQTMHDRTLDWMNRAHHHAEFVACIERCQGRGFQLGTHVILGLPGESAPDMLATAREIARLPIDSVKIHNLYVVRNTALADQFERGAIRLIDRAAYVRAVADFLEYLPADCVVERLVGDAPADFFLGPAWCLDKPAVLKAIDHELMRRDSWQGFRYQPTRGRGTGTDR